MDRAARLVLLAAHALALKEQSSVGRHAASRGLTKQVFVFRHCTRSTDTEVLAAREGFEAAENYTDRALPNWNTGVKWCTAQGSKIMEYVGSKLATTRLRNATATNLKVFVDTAQRDATSANSLLRGLSSRDALFKFNEEFAAIVFNAYEPHYGAGICTKPNQEVLLEQRRSNLQEWPMPMGVGLRQQMNVTRYYEVLEELQSLIGVGSAGPLRALPLPNISSENLMVGAPRVVEVFSKNLMYAFASGIPYTSATPEQRYGFHAWHSWYRQVMQTPALLAPKKACGLISVIEQLLSDSTSNVMYVGHDSDLDGLREALNISWQVPPWPSDNSTPPGMALVFTRQGLLLQAEALYEVLDGGKTPEIRTAPILARLPLQEAKARVLQFIQKHAGQPCIDACYSALG